MSVLEYACENYQTEYGSLPAGDNAAIAKTLRGDNPKRVVFINIKSEDMTLKGEVIDPWGTPYKFDLQNGKSPAVWSAGPNRVFGDKDDLSSLSP